MVVSILQAKPDETAAFMALATVRRPASPASTDSGLPRLSRVSWWFEGTGKVIHGCLSSSLYHLKGGGGKAQAHVTVAYIRAVHCRRCDCAGRHIGTAGARRVQSCQGRTGPSFMCTAAATLGAAFACGVNITTAITTPTGPCRQTTTTVDPDADVT